MHAHEILNALRSTGSPREVLIVNGYDRGSVEDQLWEEHAFMRSSLDPDIYVTFYRKGIQKILEVLHFMDNGKIVYLRRVGDPKWHFPENLCKTISEKRKDLGL